MKTMNNFQISGFVVNNATIFRFCSKQRYHQPVRNRINRPLRSLSSPHGEDR